MHYFRESTPASHMRQFLDHDVFLLEFRLITTWNHRLSSHCTVKWTKFSNITFFPYGDKWVSFPGFMFIGNVHTAAPLQTGTSYSTIKQYSVEFNLFHSLSYWARWSSSKSTFIGIFKNNLLFWQDDLLWQRLWCSQVHYIRYPSLCSQVHESLCHSKFVYL